MPKWSSIIQSFGKLFGGRRADPEEQSQSSESPPGLPYNPTGIGGFAARQRAKYFPSSEAPPIQDELQLGDEKSFDYQPTEDNFDGENEDGFDSVEMLGRDASYDDELWNKIQEDQIRVVSSSNVYSYAWEPEGVGQSRGILYVTFLNWEPGMSAAERSGPGFTYAYYDFPKSRFEEFNKASSASAGGAVWDFCRIRGTRHGHQHRYRLVSSSGVYVPRKATAKGFKRRMLITPGTSIQKRRMLTKMLLFTQDAKSVNEVPDRLLPGSFRRSTLGDEEFGRPNRGEPNRGRPNRGR